jgi:hypothetical protein
MMIFASVTRLPAYSTHIRHSPAVTGCTPARPLLKSVWSVK